VNLFAALERMRRAFAACLGSPATGVRDCLLKEAQEIRREDVEACRRIGELGATLITEGSTLLTHCNAGALATAGEGTALGIITTAARKGKVRAVYVDETRPLLQGSRLTSWELVREGIDVILITDSTAGAVLAQNGVDAVIVGADRIAANGDTANKIGTYPLAVLAARHHVPFYVAAPTSTVDAATPSGKEIRIEERSANEVTHLAGNRIAAEGVRVYAPAFDITPNEFITAIVTENVILRPPFLTAIAALDSAGGKMP
jgi:methylthioribose-1-phosphate isomerase